MTKRLKIEIVVYLILGLLVASFASYKHATTVAEANWQTLAKVAQSKCEGRSSCVFNLSDVYPSDWTDAYIFGYESIGYIEYWSGVKLHDPWPVDNFYGNACVSLVLVGKNHKEVLFMQTSCDESVGPNSYAISGQPDASVEFYKKDPRKDFIHIKRGSDALCAWRYDSAAAEFTFEKYDNNKGCKSKPNG